jgi:hypothetical protein
MRQREIQRVVAKIDFATLAQLRDAANEVWNTIAHDCLQACQEETGKREMTRDEVVDVVADQFDFHTSQQRYPLAVAWWAAHAVVAHFNDHEAVLFTIFTDATFTD